MHRITLTFALDDDGPVVGEHPGIALERGLHHARGFTVGAALIDALEGHRRETIANLEFILRVNILLVAEVDIDRHHSTRDVVRDPLHGLADDWPATVFHGDRLLGHEARKLDNDERKFAAPGLVPSLNHVAEDPLVGNGLTSVGLALVPDSALKAVANEGMHHPVPIHVRAVGPGRLSLRVSLGLGSTCRHGGVFLLLPTLGVRLRIIHAAGAPGFRAGAADRGDNHTNGLLELSADGGSEIISGGGETSNGVRASDFPGTLDVFDGSSGRDALDKEDADAVIARLGDGFFRGKGGTDSPVHIGLTGTHPDFADDDVFGDMGLRPGLNHQVLASFGRLQTREGRLEDAIGTRGSGGFYIAIDDFDRRTRLRLAVDVGLTGLQDGVVREDGGEL